MKQQKRIVRINVGRTQGTIRLTGGEETKFSTIGEVYNMSYETKVGLKFPSFVWLTELNKGMPFIRFCGESVEPWIVPTSRIEKLSFGKKETHWMSTSVRPDAEFYIIVTGHDGTTTWQPMSDEDKRNLLDFVDKSNEGSSPTPQKPWWKFWA